MDSDLSLHTNVTRNLLDSEFTSAFFDQASKAWMANKVRVGCQNLYRCEFIHSNRQRCKAACSAYTSIYCLKHKRVGKKREVKAEKKAEKLVKGGYNLRSRK